MKIQPRCETCGWAPPTSSGSPTPTELYQLLVGQRGWSPQRCQRFLPDAWGRPLLAD